MKRARIGLLGTGFVSNLYMQALKNVRDHDVISVFSLYKEEAKEFAAKWDIPESTNSIEEVVTNQDVDLVIIGIPHHLHSKVVPMAAEAGKAVICTKPLGRNAQEALICWKAAQKAGIWNAYAESEIFSPATVRAKELADSGALGRVYWVRFREAHAQIHEFAKDPELNGGGPLRGLGCHGVAVGRWFLGKGIPTDVFAWGDRIARNDVQSEDNGIMLIRYEDGSLSQVEVGWGHKAGLDIRTEIHGTDGYVNINDTNETGIRAFTTKSAGYIVEKAAIDHGWIMPIPDETFAFGFHFEMDHFIHMYLRNEEPWQTLRDGLIDNSIIDAAYRSIRSGTWEKVVIPE